jgi:hypothetical protein
LRRRAASGSGPEGAKVPIGSKKRTRKRRFALALWPHDRKKQHLLPPPSADDAPAPAPPETRKKKPKPTGLCSVLVGLTTLTAPALALAASADAITVDTLCSAYAGEFFF